MNLDQDLSNAKFLREKAEEKLKLVQNRDYISGLESDVKRLIHELQVHQIELEMQNEELIYSNERAEAALKKYTILYDFAPMGYFSLNQDGIILELNFTAAEMLGDRRFSLINSNFKLFISEESLPVFNNFLNMVYFTKSKVSCELFLISESDQSRNIYIEALVTGEDGQCLMSAVDLSTIRKQINL
jgi:PAS domain-containing protein